MAKLRIQAPDGKTLVVDVGNADKSEYDDLATAAVQDYMSKQGPASVADQNIAALDGKGPLDELKSMSNDIGQDVKAGYSGIADIVAGNGLDTSVSNINKVEEGKTPTTTAANIGEAIGAQFTPAQIALQAAFGKVADMIGPWVSDLMKGWSQQAARAAAGLIKRIADAVGNENLESIAEFLLKPISIGGKTFPAIVQATSSPAEMKAAAVEIQDAAGKILGKVESSMDGAITDGKASVNLGAIQQGIEQLKAAVERPAKSLGAPVVSQYEKVIEDFERIIAEWKDADTSNLFSDLRSLKSAIFQIMGETEDVVPSKMALQRVYDLLSKSLSSAADSAGQGDYHKAEVVYAQASAVIEGLSNKISVQAGKLPWGTAISLGTFAGIMTHNPISAALGFAAPLAGNALGEYAPQMGAKILSGLSAPIAKLGGNSLVSGALKLTARGIPVVGNAIYSGLSQPNDQDQ